MCQMVCLVLGIKLAEKENVMLLEIPTVGVRAPELVTLSFAVQVEGTKVP